MKVDVCTIMNAVYPISTGTVCARQREPKPHGRTDVRSQGNERFSGRVHASGEHHRRQEDTAVGGQAAISVRVLCTILVKTSLF